MNICTFIMSGGLLLSGYIHAASLDGKVTKPLLAELSDRQIVDQMRAEFSVSYGALSAGGDIADRMQLASSGGIPVRPVQEMLSSRPMLDSLLAVSPPEDVAGRSQVALFALDAVKVSADGRIYMPADKQQELFAILRTAILQQNEKKVLEGLDALSGDLQGLEVFLNRMRNQGDNATLLMYAVGPAQKNIVKKLLEYGANPYVKDCQQRGVFSYAACNSESIAREIMDMLLAYVDVKDTDKMALLLAEAAQLHNDLLIEMLRERDVAESMIAKARKYAAGRVRLYQIESNNQSDNRSVRLLAGAADETQPLSSIQPANNSIGKSLGWRALEPLSMLSLGKAGNNQAGKSEPVCESVARAMNLEEVLFQQEAVDTSERTVQSALFATIYDAIEKHDNKAFDRRLLDVKIRGISVERFLNTACNNSDGETLLMVAAREGNLQMVKKLVIKGSRIEIKDRHNKTVLSYAGQNKKKTKKDILAFLVDKFNGLYDSLSPEIYADIMLEIAQNKATCELLQDTTVVGYQTSGDEPGRLRIMDVREDRERKRLATAAAQPFDDSFEEESIEKPDKKSTVSEARQQRNKKKRALRKGKEKDKAKSKEISKEQEDRQGFLSQDNVLNQMPCFATDSVYRLLDAVAVGLCAGTRAVDENRCQREAEEVQAGKELVQVRAYEGQEQCARAYGLDELQARELERQAFLEEAQDRVASVMLAIRLAEREKKRRMRIYFKQEKNIKAVKMAEQEQERRARARELEEQHAREEERQAFLQEAQEDDIDAIEQSSLDKKLQAAAQRGEYNVVMRCIQNGANPYAGNPTALELVRQAGRESIATSMEQCFALAVDGLNEYKKRIFESACVGNSAYIDELLGRFHTHKQINTVMLPLKNSRFNIINCVNEDGETPIVIAIKNGHVKFAHALLQAFPTAAAGLYAQNKHGQTAINFLFDLTKTVDVPKEVDYTVDLLLPLVRYQKYEDVFITMQLIKVLLPEDQHAWLEVSAGSYTGYDLLSMHTNMNDAPVLGDSNEEDNKESEDTREMDGSVSFKSQSRDACCGTDDMLEPMPRPATADCRMVYTLPLTSYNMMGNGRFIAGRENAHFRNGVWYPGNNV